MNTDEVVEKCSRKFCKNEADPENPKGECGYHGRDIDDSHCYVSVGI